MAHPDNNSPTKPEQWITCADCGSTRALSTLESIETFVCRGCLGTNPVRDPTNPSSKEVPDRIWIRPTGYGSIWSSHKLHDNDVEYTRVADSAGAMVDAIVDAVADFDG